MAYRYQAKRLMSIVLVVGFVLAALAINIEKFVEQISEYSQYRGQDEYNSIFLRYQMMSDALPPCKIAGYVSDLDPGAEPARAGLHFWMMRYALAPAVLVRGTQAEVIVVDLLDSSNRNGVIERHGLTVVKDFGSGLLLSRRKAR
jgi:hypothetical protein